MCRYPISYVANFFLPAEEDVRSYFSKTLSPFLFKHRWRLLRLSFGIVSFNAMKQSSREWFVVLRKMQIAFSSISVSTVLSFLEPKGRSETWSLFLHFITVLKFIPSSFANSWTPFWDCWIFFRMAIVVVARACKTWTINPLCWCSDIGY